jgi:hypothetical protein
MDARHIAVGQISRQMFGRQPGNPALDQGIQLAPVMAQPRQIRREGLGQGRRPGKPGQRTQHRKRRLVLRKAVQPDRVRHRDVIERAQDGTKERPLVHRQRRRLEGRRRSVQAVIHPAVVFGHEGSSLWGHWGGLGWEVKHSLDRHWRRLTGMTQGVLHDSCMPGRQHSLRRFSA